MSKTTEKHNKTSSDLDLLSSIDILNIINNEDSKISGIIKNELFSIAALIDNIIPLLNKGGKIYYIGCGTSGRLGILDAAECPPTFGVSKSLVNGIISGGPNAVIESIEGAEDSIADGKNSIINNKISNLDIVIGISASNSAPFVRSALKEAYKRNALTALICCNKIKNLSYVKHIIIAIVGPEVLTGSTRMKAGTATKMILNMISTTTMVKLNKTYKNIMIDLKMSNKKLKDRGIRIISEITDQDYEKSVICLDNAKGDIKIAIVMYLLNINYNRADRELLNCNGNLRDVLKQF